MTATNKTEKFKALSKALQKRYKNLPKTAERKLLDCLMFAACLENASYEAAEAAFSVLEHHYIDWNELRVSTPQEIADTLPMLPSPLDAGERIKKTLQWVFETTYMFDLEEYRKKTIAQVVDYLDSIPSCTPFMTNYFIQHGLGGHLLPFDEAAMRIMRRLDLAKVHEGKEEVTSAERFITKNKGIEFSASLHLLGVEFFERQNSPELLEILKEIDPAAEQRSWMEPPGILKKTDIKIAPKVKPPTHKGFKPEIDLEDEDHDLADVPPSDEEPTFIDHSLASLGAAKDGSTDQKKGGKKTTSKKSKEKSSSKKKNVSEQSSETKNELSGGEELSDVHGNAGDEQHDNISEENELLNQSAVKKLQQKKPK